MHPRLHRALPSIFHQTITASLVCLTLTSCGQVPDFSAGPGIDEAPKPQGDTVVNNYEIQIGAPIGFDEKTLKAFKGVVGSPIEPFREGQDARTEKALFNRLKQEEQRTPAAESSAPSPEAGADGDDDGAAPAPSDSNAMAAQNQESSPNASSAGSLEQALGVDKPGPVLGVQAKFKGKNGQYDLGWRYVEALRKKLPKGYVPYEAELEGGELDDGVIAVIKSSDPYEPIRIAGTTGGGLLKAYGTEDIINQLKTWNQKYPLHVVAAEHDKVVAILDKAPADPTELGKELQKFAPGDGSAGVKDFIDDVRSRQLFMWWD